MELVMIELIERNGWPSETSPESWQNSMLGKYQLEVASVVGGICNHGLAHFLTLLGRRPPPLPPQVALEPLSSTGPLHSCVGSRVNVQAGTWSGTFHHCSNGGTRLCLHGWTKTLNRRMNSKSPVVSSIMSGVFRLARVSATQAQPHYQRGMVTCCDGCECCCSQLRNTAVGSKYRCGSQRSHCDANGEGCTMLYNFQHISLNCIF